MSNQTRQFPWGFGGWRRLALVFLAALAAGCAGAKPNMNVVQANYTGQYGQARAYLVNEVGADKMGDKDHIDRDYLLNRMRLMIAMLADGYAPPDNPVVNRVYSLLRTQGLNADKTVTSVVVNEDLKIWKGEPFEQAMAFEYISIYEAELGSWDNARAAIGNSLFQLRDFGTNGQGQELSSEELVRNASQRGDSYFDSYRATPSDFTLGYLMTAITNQQVGIATGDPNRIQEANANYDKVLSINPGLGDLVQSFRSGQYNTVLVVDAGIGPQKVGVGPDHAIVDFMPHTFSDFRPLMVDSPGGGAGAAYPWVCDLNRMAMDHRWRNLEDLRIAKSLVGSVLLAGGAGTAGYGLATNNQTAEIVGAGLAVAGLFAKAGAHADTRYCEMLPQRVYVVPVNVTSPDSTFTVQIEGEPGSRFDVMGLSPPKGPAAQLRYVRLVGSGYYAPFWATSGQILYSNDSSGEAPGPQLPYILGGHCVRTPSEAALESYRRSGYLRDVTLDELEALYRAEGIAYDVRQEGGTPGLHVLEGGRSLACPLSGTLGFDRLFCQEHPPYQPRSREVQEMVQRIHQQAQGQAPSN